MWSSITHFLEVVLHRTPVSSWPEKKKNNNYNTYNYNLTQLIITIVNRKETTKHLLLRFSMWVFTYRVFLQQWRQRREKLLQRAALHWKDKLVWQNASFLFLDVQIMYIFVCFAHSKYTKKLFKILTISALFTISNSIFAKINRKISLTKKLFHCISSTWCSCTFSSKLFAAF